MICLNPIKQKGLLNGPGYCWRGTLENLGGDAVI